MYKAGNASSVSLVYAIGVMALPGVTTMLR